MAMQAAAVASVSYPSIMSRVSRATRHTLEGFLLIGNKFPLSLSLSLSGKFYLTHACT